MAHRVPSALEIFANRNSLNDNSNFYPAPYSSAPIIRMKQLWEICDNPAGDTVVICQKIRPAGALIRANYNNYWNAYQDWLSNPADPTKTWNKWACKLPAVSPLTEDLLLQQLYGWTPFAGISNCDAKANQLADTPNLPTPYQTTKIWFDEAQYWFYFNAPPGSSDYGQWTNPSQQDYAQFDPYVPLIHGRDFMNSPYTYAYSVDDAFGNMQADGTGLIIAVGGSKGLPLPDNHVTSEVVFSLGGQSTYAPPSATSPLRHSTAAKTPPTPKPLSIPVDPLSLVVHLPFRPESTTRRTAS